MKLIILPILGSFVLAAPALAQYTGPSSAKVTTVADALKDAKDGVYVQLQGKVVRQVGDEKYIFADKTGEIRVEIDAKDFKAPVNAETVVEIRGEIEKDFLQSPEIDVDSLVVVGK